MIWQMYLCHRNLDEDELKYEDCLKAEMGTKKTLQDGKDLTKCKGGKMSILLMTRFMNKDTSMGMCGRMLAELS